MPKNSNQKIDFLLYYQGILGIGLVFVFFTFVDGYFYAIGTLPPPVTFVILFAAAAFILLIFSFSSVVNYIPIKLIVWCIGFVTISCFSLSFFPFSGEPHFEELRNRILSVLFLLISYLIFSKYPKVQNWVRGAIFLAVLLTICNNIREFSDPSVFGGFNDSGRAAGYYMNPNRTGCALILGMIFSIGLLPQKHRIFFALVVIFGVFLTFSRGAIIGWCLVMSIFLQSGSIPRKQLLFWVLGIITIIFILGPTLSNLFDLEQLQRSGLINVNLKNITERLEWFQNPATNSEDSADSRMEVAKVAWNLFVKHPILGNGIASTEPPVWNESISTHNTYLFFMADHGFLGAFVLPLLLYAVTRHSRGESKLIALAFTTFILLWGFFSHNIIGERYILMSFSLMAAMNMTSRLEQKSE